MSAPGLSLRDRKAEGDDEQRAHDGQSTPVRATRMARGAHFNRRLHVPSAVRTHATRRRPLVVATQAYSPTRMYASLHVTSAVAPRSRPLSPVSARSRKSCPVVGSTYASPSTWLRRRRRPAATSGSGRYWITPWQMMRSCRHTLPMPSTRELHAREHVRTSRHSAGRGGRSGSLPSGYASG